MTIKGVFLGGLFLALAENFGVWVFASEWRDAVAFVIFIIFLSIKPWLGELSGNIYHLTFKKKEEKRK
jgi:branched-subunit amino acid ABC-type transport system permease component